MDNDDLSISHVTKHAKNSDLPDWIYIPESDDVIHKFTCPDCGGEIRAPSGGHTWTCHETYGGCGAKFKPIRAFKRVNE